VSPFDSEKLLRVFESVENFCLGIPIDGAKRLLNPAVGGHNVLLESRTAGC
jgi:hypothetical protein